MRLEREIPTAEKAVPKKRSITSKELTVQLDLKKMVIPAVVLAAVILVVFIIFQDSPKKLRFQYPRSITLWP